MALDLKKRSKTFFSFLFSILLAIDLLAFNFLHIFIFFPVCEVVRKCGRIREVYLFFF